MNFSVGAGMLVCFVLGAATGFAEIISRYRDEPLRASFNVFGVGYMVLNGALAVGAMGLLLRYPTQILPPVAGDMLLTASAAGFGAMAVFRSKFFIFRTEDGREHPIGPAIVLEAILRMLDRKIDRLRSSRRQRIVFDNLSKVEDYKFASNYLIASLLSFQNLSQDEKADVSAVVEEYKRPDLGWPPALRTMAIGFAFLTIAGEEHFAEVIANMNQMLARTAAGAAAPPPTPSAPARP